ncbi:MAG: aldehyde dehydrogenase family protein, partial [Caldilinea sp.]
MMTTTATTEISHAVTEFLQREQRLLIDGKWLPAQTGATFATLNPATGKPLCYVAAGDATDVNAAVAAAQRALPLWTAT